MAGGYGHDIAVTVGIQLETVRAARAAWQAWQARPGNVVTAPAAPHGNNAAR